MKEQSRKRRAPLRYFIHLLLALALVGFGLSSALAAPPAGTSIGNQASATYTDDSNVGRTATSNVVSTIVKQVASFTLTQNGSKTISPGSTVYFTHTLTNTGNGADTFDLSAVDADTGTIAFTSLKIFADADGNGVPDSGTEVAITPSLAPGASYKFVVAATVPADAAAAESETITVTGESNHTPSETETNTDTVTVTGNAVLLVTKALSLSSGPSPSAGPITVTLTYTNNGNSAASDVILTDVIGSGATAGMTYVADSGQWSGGATVTDAAAGDSSGLAYDWDVTTADTVTAVISSVGPGASGFIKFNVTINSGLPPGAATTTNTAKFAYNDKPAGGGDDVGPTNTNTAAYTVLAAAGVVANGSSTDHADGVDEPVTVATALQGATVTFSNYIWNTGNGTDTFDITLGSSTFPAGTVFQLYKSDGATPLTSSAGTADPDTGPVLVATDDAVDDKNEYKVVIKATLPANASGDNGGSGFSVTLTATSATDPTKSNTVVNTLGAITGNTVDLTNNYARDHDSCNGDEVDPDLCGYGYSTGEADPQTTETVNPGATASFTLYVKNTSAVADTYNLFADDDNTWADPVVNDLPTGWTVSFHGGECPASGAPVTNTGVVNADASTPVCATLDVPANASPGNVEIYFRALSPTTGAVDTKHDRVSVNTVRNLSVSPENSGQVYPGGSVVYTHILKNNGNVTEGDNSGSTVTLGLSDSLSGWTSVVYYDLNGDNALDAADPIVPAAGIHAIAGVDPLDNGLSAGESARFFVKVTASASAGIGDINKTTLTATTANGTLTGTAPVDSVDDTTQVIAGQVRLVKTQALDTNCDGTADTAFTTGQLQGNPGECVRYQIVATNDGTADVTTLVLSDSTPAHSTFDDGSRDSAGGACGTGAVDADAATTVGSITAPDCGDTGSITATIGTLGTLGSNKSATVTFGIMINK
ncbi:hypothetical protein [uncultured Desulfuromonas sp.]|uniref:beta strand repeat-containing protein n=1 Tax=uncultured Desulfuromonas sp. TaxID=181013 RepID=UPI00260FFFFB|nr:hypothetical protein [uncultured Desulfuromonas sp.]